MSSLSMSSCALVLARCSRGCSSRLVSVGRRTLSDGAATRGGKVIYRGALAGPIKSLKRVSATSCVMSGGLAVAPFVLSTSVPVSGQLALMGTVISVAVGTTVLQHFVTKPYITELTANGEENGERIFEAVQMNVLGMEKRTTFTLDRVQPMPGSSRPFMSFSVEGKPYYVHGGTFEDKVLLQKLLGRALKESEL